MSDNPGCALSNDFLGNKVKVWKNGWFLKALNQVIQLYENGNRLSQEPVYEQVWPLEKTLAFLDFCQLAAKMQLAELQWLL